MTKSMQHDNALNALKYESIDVVDEERRNANQTDVN